MARPDRCLSDDQCFGNPTHTRLIFTAGITQYAPLAPFNSTIGDGTKTTSILPFVTACADLSTPTRPEDVVSHTLTS